MRIDSAVRALAVLFVAVCSGQVGAAELGDLDFMVGHWSADALGGVAEEVWLPARGDAMHGVFRLVVAGEMQFSEFIQVTEDESGVLMRFAHFRPDYSTWEGDASPMELRLADVDERYARFTAANDRSPEIVYRLDQDGLLVVQVAGVDEPFRFRRID